MGRVYISGPISSPDPEKQAANLDEFHAAEAILIEYGWEVSNPARNGLPVSASWQEHMRADIRMLTECDTVAMLDGWEGSRGAQIEAKLAADLGLRVVPIGELVEG